MITKEAISCVLGSTAFDRDHDKIGRIGNVYVDDLTGDPEWMTVQTSRFGGRETFVPISQAELRGDDVVLPFQKEQVSNAPNVDPKRAGHLSERDELKMYEYYGMSHPGVQPTSRAKPTDDAMTRSEEIMHVGKETRDAGRVHLRKYVVTEDQQQTIPVHREKVHLEHEPITDENRERAMSGPDISEAEYEVVRREERPVMGKETVPVERVRLTTEDTVHDETVGGQVRRERIEAEGLADDER